MNKPVDSLLKNILNTPPDYMQTLSPGQTINGLQLVEIWKQDQLYIVRRSYLSGREQVFFGELKNLKSV